MQEKPGSTEAPGVPTGTPVACPSGWRRWTGHGIRVTFWSILAVTLLFVAVVAVTRFWLVPNADSFRPRVVAELTRLTGQRVVIGGFEAGWNGWSPELKMTRLQILDTRGRTLLQLPEVDTTISWRSLFFFEPRLSALTVRAPRVVVRRTAENALTVAGIDLDLSNQSEGDPGLVEWLLKQRLVQISGGELEWQDEWRKLPPVRLQNVNIRLVNSGSHHSIGMNAVPPPSLAAPIDLRCEFTGSDMRKISDWDGLAYLRADYADLGALTRYFPLPLQVSRGEGGMQAWFEFEDGRPVAVTTDLAVKNARIQLPAATVGSGASQPEPLDLATLTGRLSWREKKLSRGDAKPLISQQRWSIRDVVAITPAGVRAPTGTGEVLIDYRDDIVTGGALRVAELDVGNAAAIARTLPLTAEVANQLVALQPKGLVRNADLKWQDEGASATLGRFFVDGGAELRNLSWRQQGSTLGVTGLNALAKGSSQRGELTLLVGTPESKNDKSRRPMTLDFGHHFDAPFVFDGLRGKLSWNRSPGKDGMPAATVVDISGVEFENADVVGRVNGTWESDRLGPGIANMTGSLSRAETTAIHRYLPTSMSERTRQWLKQGILGGTSQDAKFTLKGALWHFPFRNDENGIFEVNAQVTGGILDYADRWPRAENINTRLLFRGARMDAQVAGATIAGVPIASTDVRIADMGADSPVLEIKGSAAGPMDAFLRWTVASPVNGWLDGFLQNARATGTGRLNLTLNMPLDAVERTKLNGEFAFSGNRIELGGDIPPLDSVNGRLRFTESDVRTTEISAEALGGPLKLSIVTEAGRIKTIATGNAALEKVRERYAYPLIDQLTGTVQWQLDMSQPTRVPAGAVADSTMQITATTVQPRWPLDTIVQLPAGPRDAAAPIRAVLTRAQLDRGRDRLTIDLPGQLHAILERTAANAAGLRTVERATLDVGVQRTALPTRGYALRGDVAKLDADAAIALLTPMSLTGARSVGGLNSDSTSADFVNINLRATEAVLYAHRFNDVTLRAQPVGQRWRLALRSKEATGAIALDTNAETGAVDAISVRLQRLSFPTPVAAAAPSTASPAAPAGSGSDSGHWPKLDLVADSFVSEGRDLGKLEVKAQPAKDEWQIEQVRLTSADGSIDAKGRWRPRSALSVTGNTEVDVALKWGDAGKFMSRFGLPKGVERGQGSLTGTLSWPGSPAQFSYAKLAGKFSLETAQGRFTEMEPGIAKLLGVLSLQSLPRRLSFNFDDLFGRGLAFDEVKAEVMIADGIAKTDGFVINGPSARVQIRGSADINRETQELQVRVYPSLSTATAIGIGLATANPAIGAAALLGQKLARDPIERMLMQEFEVKGTWATPDVKPIGTTQAPSRTVTTTSPQ
jgi:uncharacterized protein (TIGR02099 family)